MWKDRYTYESYKSARTRCMPTCKDHEHYYDRGIRFLLPPFQEFLMHLGPRPQGLTLERMDNDGNYEVGNVKWATRSDQMKNCRKRKLITNYSNAEILAEVKRRGL